MYRPANSRTIRLSQLLSMDRCPFETSFEPDGGGGKIAKNDILHDTIADTQSAQKQIAIDSRFTYYNRSGYWRCHNDIHATMGQLVMG